MNKQKLLISAAVLLATAGAIGIGLSNNKIYADTPSKYSPLVQKLIDTFHLNTTEVDKVVSEVRTERQAQMEQRQQERLKTLDDKLTQAVKDGKITQSQKDQILAKYKEFQDQNEEKRKKVNMSQLTQEQRQAQRAEWQKEMTQRRADFQAWEKSIGVDLQSLLGNGFFGPWDGMGPGMGRGGPRGFNN